MVVEKQKMSYYLLSRLFKNHVMPYKVRVSIAIFFMALYAACTTFIIKLVSMSADAIFSHKDHHSVILLPALLLAAFVIKGVSEYFQYYIMRSVGQHVLNDIQILLYKHLLHSDVMIFNKHVPGSIVSRFTNDIATIRTVISYFVIGVVKHLLTVVFAVIAMFQLEPKLALFAFTIFPLSVVIVKFITKRISVIAYNTQVALSEYTKKLSETFQSIKVIKSFLAEDLEQKKLEKHCTNILTLYEKTAKLSAMIPMITEILNGIAVAGILWYSGWMILQDQSTPGVLFGFIAGFVSAYRPFKYIITFSATLEEGLAAIKRVFEMLDDHVLIEEVSQPYNDVIKDVQKVEFSGIGLYIDNDPLIENINFQCNKSEITAIVGKSGSGKTTLMNMLMRFSDSSKGVISINDFDIKKISLRHLRENISIVSQDTLLFSDTIINNIRYSNPDATIDEIDEASKIACIDEFINSLENKYETMIGADGKKLSGGQMQRIAIARALLKKSKILIFDEATSSLDAETESLILKNIKGLKSNKIIFIITHRIPNITDVDKIIVMSKGRIECIGTHEQLIKNQNTYYQLWSTCQNSDFIFQNNS